MATYTYLCPTHGQFDIQMSMADHTNVYRCTQCNNEAPQVIGISNVIFKGSDWASKKIPVYKPNNDWKGKGSGYI